jgi:hypothetical protein
MFRDESYTGERVATGTPPSPSTCTVWAGTSGGHHSRAPIRSGKSSPSDASQRTSSRVASSSSDTQLVGSTLSLCSTNPSLMLIGSSAVLWKYFDNVSCTCEYFSHVSELAKTFRIGIH